SLVRRRADVSLGATWSLMARSERVGLRPGRPAARSPRAPTRLPGGAPALRQGYRDHGPRRRAQRLQRGAPALRPRAQGPAWRSLPGYLPALVRRRPGQGSAYFAEKSSHPRSERAWRLVPRERNFAASTPARPPATGAASPRWLRPGRDRF